MRFVPNEDFTKSIKKDLTSGIKNLESKILEKLEKSIEKTHDDWSHKINDIVTASMKSDVSQNQRDPDDGNKRNDELSDTLKEVRDSLKLKKEKEEVKEKARTLKISVSAEWNEAVNNRKKSYWNFIMNRNKAKLYQRWAEESPEFLPKKFRPKRIKDEDRSATELRIKQARSDYINNISLLKRYEKIHDEKCRTSDERMIEKINSMTNHDLEVRRHLSNLWWEEIASEESRSLSMWNKRERFLNKMKHEELKAGNFTLV